MENVIVPKFILLALSECLEAGLIPSIRMGNGGNSHTVWFISFFVGQKQYEIKIVSSCGGFLEFISYSGFDCIDYLSKPLITSILKSL